VTDNSGSGMVPPPYGQQPSPGSQPYGAPPQYQPQPAYGAQQPPQPPKRGNRTGVWVGVGVVAVGVVVVVLVFALSPGGKPGPAHPSSTSSAGPTSASGPLACELPGTPTSGSGPWKLVQPKTLCHLPPDTRATDIAAAQEELNSTELVFDPVGEPSPGNYTSAFGVGYEIPSAEADDWNRFINVVGFTGTFNPQVAVSELAQLDENPDIPGNVFKTVPPGPHGGLMECAPVYSSEECVFGTSTTLGQFTIDDTLNELTGANMPANAIRIRDALEVPA
jgi:hypothetical protein